MLSLTHHRLSSLARLASFATALASLAMTASALAEPAVPPPTSASQGAPATDAPHGTTFSLSLERVGGVAYSSLHPTSSTDSLSVTTFGIGGPSLNPVALPRVGFDVVLASGLTVGAAVGFGFVTLSDNPQSGDGQSESLHAFLISPRIGYRIALAPWLDLTPRAGVTFASAGFASPDGRSCAFGQVSGAPACTSVKGDSASLFAVAASLEVVAALRVTRSFNILVGVAYDHVVSASGTTEASRFDGSRQSNDANVDGKYLGAQLWLGLGGYF